jgi:PBP1b-binding outer membrane lipoprotein LpoB
VKSGILPQKFTKTKIKIILSIIAFSLLVNKCSIENSKNSFFKKTEQEKKDKKRRKSYLTRTAKMPGQWKTNRYSANNLSRNVLW